MMRAPLALAVVVAFSGAAQADGGFEFRPNTLVLSRSVYVGTPSLLVPGVTVLPPGCVAGTVNVLSLRGVRYRST
jgi:hypothetical protein